MSLRLCLFSLILALLTLPIASAEPFSPLAPDLAPHYQPEEEIEAGFWMQVDKVEENIKNSPHRITEPKLNEYVSNMVCKLAQEYCQDIRVYIMRQPYFNASMYPNGMMVVWSGLLLRTKNEDQLAAVLGHEIGHYLKRHTMKRYLDIKGKSNFSMILAVGLGLAGAGSVSSITDLLFMGSIYGHSRDNEREADKYGAQLMHNAGYDVGEASKIWDNLIAEDKASKLYDPKDKSDFSFFATHPAPEDRAETLSEYATQLGNITSEQHHNDQYHALFHAHLETFLRDQILLNHPGRSSHVISELEKKQTNLGVLNYFKGEMYKQRKEDGDLEKAEQAYIKALSYDDAPIQTHRELGLISLKLKKAEQAKRHFNAYLEQAENAKDREMVEFYLSMEM
jgi:predicted Zn-dependent protease